MRDAIRVMNRVVVAFSGGTDSTFALKVATDVLGVQNVIAATGQSDSLATSEREHAVQIAKQLGVAHHLIATDEFADPRYLSNPTNRCFYCKDELYGRLRKLADENGFNVIINGINADDLGDWRPGIQAARQHHVRTPIADAGIGKSEVRAISLELGLPTHDKPASPCLSSRVQYGESITSDKLRQIESCEGFLHRLGIVNCRVRHHDTIARIEVAVEDMPIVLDAENRNVIQEHFKGAGYRYVTLDVGGFRSGSMNDVIPLDQLTSKLTVR